MDDRNVSSVSPHFLVLLLPPETNKNIDKQNQKPNQEQRGERENPFPVRNAWRHPKKAHKTQLEDRGILSAISVYGGIQEGLDHLIS
ncbi:unnamed protein product [Sphenostylis stenocarpa]|uniref:Uncharacterized protein n=1 Tax=Sphenostylis stenocarpa TaxID=92480 RepID=A0AA86T750_9FABA|nr:unnamed protein product [Sphenostylis stenocarpa]